MGLQFNWSAADSGGTWDGEGSAWNPYHRRNRDETHDSSELNGLLSLIEINHTRLVPGIQGAKAKIIFTFQKFALEFSWFECQVSFTWFGLKPFSRQAQKAL